MTVTYREHATASEAWNDFHNKALAHGLTFDTDLSKEDRLASAFANLLQTPSPATHYFVDTYSGSASANGLSWATALSTMTAALALVQTGGTIHFRGKVAEECIGSNLVFDVTIIGHGSLHHADQPGSGDTAVHYGAAVWQAPASPTTATPLLKIRGRGWNIVNVLFDCPVDGAAIYLERNALSGTSEYDASHASIVGCDFRNGLYGVRDVGGCFNVLIKDCVFETLDATTSGAGIICTSTAVANPRRYRILNNFFQNDSSTEGSERHIIGAFVGSLIKENVFGTVKNTGKYIDLTGGSGNAVIKNALGGAYDTGDYVAGTNDMWLQNMVAAKATTAPDGLSLVAPGA
jgi:hypothetical protein